MSSPSSSSSSSSPHFRLILTALVALQACSHLGVYHFANGSSSSSSSYQNSINSRDYREHYNYRSYPSKSLFTEGRSKKLISPQNDDSDSAGCKSIETEIQVSKEEKVTSTGQLVRVCEGLVRVAKCEGVCSSRLRPWINSPSGFLKVF